MSDRYENSGWEHDAARIAVVVVTFNSADVHPSVVASPTTPPRTKASRSPKRRPTSRLGSSSSAAMRVAAAINAGIALDTSASSTRCS